MSQLFLLLSVVFFTLTSLSEVIVSVRLNKNLTTVQLEGERISIRPEMASISEVISNKFNISYSSGEGVEPVWTIKNLDGDFSQSFHGKQIFVESPHLKIGSSLAPTAIMLFGKSKGKFDIIAQLNLEDYLKGVLPAEMPALWPMEALKAQAIASRSYTLAMLKKRRKKHYNMESSVLDQVFDLNKIGLNSKMYKKVSRAIDETKGQVLFSKKKKRLFQSHYHADCGGHTEEPKEVWSRNISNGTVKDPYCPSERNSSWKARFTFPQLNRILRTKLQLDKSAVFSDLLVLNKTASGRARNIKLKFSDQERVVSGQKLRELFGFSKMKSTLFEVSKNKKHLTIAGRGNGHGVGLCQYGARGWAQNGKSHKDILRHYYPNAKIVDASLKK